ncbi:MAG: P-loop NTPase fold protein [Pyrinomonadaceae bacterium]
MVVFIADLDRCFPDTIIETLEAIKLFLFVPGTAFILGADERLIEYAISAADFHRADLFVS